MLLWCDKQLTYLGFSYGTYLGQVYANMFPDRVRAMILDGVLDPITWSGTKATAATPMPVRIKSAQDAYTALTTIMKLCDKAGADLCPLAGNAMQRYTKVANTLKVKPLVATSANGTKSTLTYASFIGLTQSILMDNSGMAPLLLTGVTEFIEQALNPHATSSSRAAANLQVGNKLEQLSKQRSFGFQYDNGLDVFSAVMCTDSLNSASLSSFPKLAAAAEKQTPFFGTMRAWQASQCAADEWKVKDATAYRGPFNRKTATGVLVVGNYFDPATNYGNAARVSQLLPGARLLTSNSFGHTAFGASDCVNNAMVKYLVTKTLPKAGTVCQPTMEPFPAMDSARTATPHLNLPGISPVLAR